MARITFGSQGEAEVKKADAKANVPDFLCNVPETENIEDFFVGGFVRVWGGWVYITQLSEQSEQVVAVAKMRLATFAKWLAVAVTQGADGWSAEPTWGLRTLPKYARADWASSRFGVVFHPEEEEEAPYTKGAFLSAWVAVAALSGGSYPSAGDWGWTTSKTWFVPRDYGDAPLTYKGQELSLAIEKMAKDYLDLEKGTSQERKSKKLFNTIEEDIPF